MAEMAWKDKWTTKPSPTQAHAFIGVDAKLGHTFRFNPDEVNWDYTNNVFSQDTLGGRVIQLLSVSLNGIVVNGRAGSRGELQRLAKNMKEIMGHHVNTLEPVQFKVPSRQWNFKVYVQSMPTITWDVSATSYPYQINLLVEEDLNGIKTKEINTQVLKRLAAGIGYDYSKHGGDAYTYKRQYEILTQSQANGEDVEVADPEDPDDVTDTTGCGTPPDLEKYKNITLQRGALTAFKNAEKEVGKQIKVSSSYRTCEQQQAACNDICNGGCKGCPGLCAPCGESYHQKGLAVDLLESPCHDAKVKKALTNNGWCFPESLRSSDPCHTSYNGCG